ncbi:hypothetical protein B484DRAFT_429392 [Ochromonadaceae sp. CCMP2298]|nr:hypothetical protein B484DRAFT_429392 [Ochromonadaceae sp. CCMP2298]
MSTHGAGTIFLVVAGLLACALLQLHLNTYSYTLQLLSNSAVVGGLLSGGLHALTGPDHLAALLPLILGRRWWRSGCVGAAWGLGHGLTSAIIGFLSCSMKRLVLRAQSVEGLGDVADAAVGVTLIVIGVTGYYEASGPDEAETKVGQTVESEGFVTDTESNIDNGDEEAASIADAQTSSMPGAALIASEWCGSTGSSSLPIAGTTVSGRQQREQREQWALWAVLVNGCMLGLSWDGLPSLAPAVIMSPPSALPFLLAYAFSTAGIMSLAAGLVGELTCWARGVKGGFSERLAALSSLLAVAMGVCWVVAAAARLLGLRMAHLHGHARTGTLGALPDDVVEGNDGSGYPYAYPHDHVGVHAALGGASLLAVLGVLAYALRREFELTPQDCSLLATLRGRGKSHVHKV